MSVNGDSPAVPTLARVGPPDLGQTGRTLFEATEPAGWAEWDTDYAWRRFLSALSWYFDVIAAMTRPEDGAESWDPLGSPLRCPEEWLPVLAQWAGVKRADALEVPDLRELLATGGGAIHRGTKAWMVAQIRRFYGVNERADPPVWFEERAATLDRPDGDPYVLRIFVYSFVEMDERAIRKRLWQIKPAGLQPIIFEVRDGQNYWQARECDYTYWQINVGFRDWRDFYQQFPGRCRDVPPTPEPVAGEYSNIIRAAKPIHYWRMGEPVVNRVAWDSVGNAHGAYQGTRRLATGLVLNTKRGSTLFDGGHVQIPNARRPDEGTIEFWTALDAPAMNVMASGQWLGEDDPDLGLLAGADGGTALYWGPRTASSAEAPPLGTQTVEDGEIGHYVAVTVELLPWHNLDGGTPGETGLGLDGGTPGNHWWIPPPVEGGFAEESEDA
jgi:hypothetical protein